jgi:hypothetical protein
MHTVMKNEQQHLFPLGTAKYLTGAELPAIQDLYITRFERKAWKIIKDRSHPSPRRFSQLPHSKQYWSKKSDNNRLFNSFYPQAVRLLNSFQNVYTDYLH